MNYIGIRGHRGAGKSSIAYLLGNTLNLMSQGHSKLLENEEAFDSFYNHWCKQLMESENCLNETSLDYVYFESFSDQIKTFIQLLLGCPCEYMQEDKYKDSVVVNLRDLSCKLIESFSETPKLITAQEFYKTMPYDYDEFPVAITSNNYMTLREFIMYFGLEVMQRFFGRNVWVKSLINNDVKYPVTYNDTNFYKIFADAKFPSEITYIKNNGGLVVKVNRPKYKKKGKDMLKHDDRYDYEVNIGDSLESLSETIWDIAIDIINKNYKNGKEN
jgi:hypothetical protein